MIEIVDEMPGTGKSTKLLEIINSEPEQNYLWVTPFLDEAGDDDTGILGRVREATPNLEFVTPSNKRFDNKTEHLKYLLGRGENVSITHSLFTKIDKEMAENIGKNNYRVIVDETIEKVSLHSNRIVKQKALVETIKGFIDLGVISVGEFGQLSWVGMSVGGYEEEQRLCNEGLLFFHKDRLIIKRYSSRVYELAQSVTVLTYMFRASSMRVWLDACGIPYRYINLPLEKTSQGQKNLLKELITIEDQYPEIDAWQPNGSKSSCFSSTWYKQAKDVQLSTISDIGTRLYGRWYRQGGNTAPKILYTCFKDYAEDVAGKGCKKKDYSDPDSNFVAKNARAVNGYADRNHIIYLVNTYPLVDVKEYLDSIVEPHQRLNSDEYALSEMIQFVFRSALRKSKPVKIYIASERMKHLFLRWLDQPEIAQDN